MSSWNTETTVSQHDSNTALNTQIGGRNRDTFETSGLNFGGYEYSEAKELWNDWLGSSFGTMNAGYDMVGIAGPEVENMREAIRAYVSNVQNVLKKVIEDSSNGINAAFRGSQAQEAVISYLEKVRLYINNLTSDLLSFSDKLADVGNAWKKAQEAIAGNINTSTGSFSEGTAYTENVTYNAE